MNNISIQNYKDLLAFLVYKMGGEVEFTLEEFDAFITNYGMRFNYNSVCDKITLEAAVLPPA
jgi:hypothetical protein